MISIIAAIGKNREVGAKNALLWQIPGELKRFKEITMGHPIIMGRKTFESIGRVLPGRTNIIITRDKNYKVDGAVVVGSLEEALGKSRQYTVESIQKNKIDTKDSILNTNKPEVFIIGGGQIFKEALEKDLVDRLYLTLVDKEFPRADTFFPEYLEFTKIIDKTEMVGPEFNYTFLTLEK